MMVHHHEDPSILLLKVVLLINVIACTNAHTALLFGASGAVGSSIFDALSDNPLWDEIIMIGRRFPETTNNVNAHDPRISKVKLPDLTNVDEEEIPSQLRADACFIAVGVGDPQDREMYYWHSIDVEMVASMARLCDKIGVRYISLLSAVTSEKDPTAFDKKDLVGQGPLGWWRMIANYDRMKGLSENAVVTASKSISYVRIFQPSTIVTETYRYGWVDRIIFKIHKVLDPVIPKRYRSVGVKLLGMAMAGDAANMLQTSKSDDSAPDGNNVSRLTYDDFMKIAGGSFNAMQPEQGDYETDGNGGEM